MRKVVRLSLPKRLADDIGRLARRLGVPRSLLVRQALEIHVQGIEFEELRRRLRARAVAQGLLIDEDIFTRVS